MKGLLYRELYLARKSYISGFLDVLVISFSGILVRLSAIYGNLSNLGEDAFFVTDFYTYNLFVYLPAFAALASFMNEGGVIISDSKCHGDIFLKTTSVGAVKLAAVKYIILALSMAAGLAFGLINGAVICGINGKTLTSDIVKNMVIIAAAVTIVTAASIPLLIRFKSQNAAFLFAFIPVIAIYIFGSTKRADMIYLINTQFKAMDEANIGEEMQTVVLMQNIGEKFGAVRDKVFVYAIAVIILMFALGFAFTVQLLKRREK